MMAKQRTGYPVIDEILESIAPPSAVVSTKEQPTPDTEHNTAKGAKPRKRLKNLGNTQCGQCLNIFPVRGTLPQDVNCPRCGVAMRLEWKTGETK